jgi:hypothetical protein
VVDVCNDGDVSDVLASHGRRAGVFEEREASPRMTEAGESGCNLSRSGLLVESSRKTLKRKTAPIRRPELWCK